MNTKSRLTKWEQLLNDIKSWRTTSNHSTINEMYDDLLTIKCVCDQDNDNDGYLRAEECLHFMRNNFHAFQQK